ncbi:MAG: hypothetical protein VB957_00105 [Pseudomonadales bacterium]|jgi:hypothetical protein
MLKLIPTIKVKQTEVQMIQRQLLLVILILLTSACQTAFLTLPGGTLVGEEAETDSFAFASEFALLQLETRPSDPYSIWLRVVVLDGRLYIDAAPGRRWHKYLSQDPDIRIKLGQLIYRANARVVTDKRLLEEFLNGRTIYRLDPRAPIDNSPIR